MAKKNMSRRDFLRAAGAGAVAATSVGLPLLSAPLSAVRGQAEPSGEVIFWGHDQHPLDLAGEGFMEKYPGVKWVSPHPADWVTKLQAAMAAGQDVPDLVWLEATQVNDLSCVGGLYDLTAYLEPVKDQYHPLKLNEAMQPIDGKYYGWPGDISLSAWYYREDLLAEAGYGDIDFETWTWDDFIAMSADIASQGKYTFCFPGASWEAIYAFLTHQLGGSYTDASGAEITVNSEAGIQAMTILKRLYESGGGIDVPWWSAGYWTALQEGEILGDFAAAWAKGFWEAQLTEETGAGKWRLAKFPGGEGILHRTGIWGGATLCTTTYSTNIDNAIAYMQYALGSVEGTARVGGWGIIPAYRPYLESDTFLEGRSPIFGDWAFNQFWASLEPELSPTYFRRAGYGPISTAITTKMPDIMRGDVTIEDGMNQIVELARPDVERVACV